MAKQRGDKNTFDLLTDWTPPEIVKRFDEQRVRTASLRARIAHAVAETLRDSGLKRGEIAGAMSEWLGEEVTKNMLDAYASEAREAHTIPYMRLLALIHVTGDVRSLQTGAELFGQAVIPDRYLAAVEDALISEQIETLKKRQPQLRRVWKVGK